MEKEVLLSILIPTYNGASKYLDRTLNSIIEGVKLCDERSIEIIVSSNASTDNTLELIKQFEDYQYIKCFSNDINIGFARNIIKLTDEYAKGKYGWVIGDDDVIIPSAIPAIVEELRHNKLDYLSVGFKFVKDADYLNMQNNYNIVYCNFAEILERAKPGNGFGTFMSSAIVRLSLFQQVPKNEVTPNFDTFQSIFPNGYVNVTAYHDKACAYIDDEVILSFIHEKGWDTSDNMYYISEHIMPKFYNYILSLGIKKENLSRTYKKMLHNALYHGYLRIVRFKKVDNAFLSLWANSLKYPSVHFDLLKTVLRIIGRKIKLIN